MKTLIVLFSVWFLCVDAKILFLETEWQNFKSLHGKLYRSLLDETRRFSIFQKNLRKIEEHNALYEKGLKTYELGITKFADLSTDEFKELLTFRKSNWTLRGERTLTKLSGNVTIPRRIDWREKGAVTEVKDQGFCGACWAFSSVGSLEAQYYLKHNALVSFSSQQLIDCATESYGAEGCNGGEFEPAFSYIRDNGIEKEASYPYEMFDGKCRYDKEQVVTKIKSFVNIEPNNEEALVAAVGLVGPVSVAIDATFIQFYRGGIYNDDKCRPDELNHAVLAVGYDSKDGHDYWIIKNSWGKNFGENGYIYMKRGENQCGIAVQPSYPVL